MPAIKCKGCDNIAKTPKGWCSGKCYAQNQRFGENKAWFKPGHITTNDTLLKIGKKSKEWHKNNSERFKEIMKKTNVVVIKKDIHKDFHKKYGYQWATKEKWLKYINENQYAC